MCFTPGKVITTFYVNAWYNINAFSIRVDYAYSLLALYFVLWEYYIQSYAGTGGYLPATQYNKLLYVLQLTSQSVYLAVINVRVIGDVLYMYCYVTCQERFQEYCSIL